MTSSMHQRFAGLLTLFCPGLVKGIISIRIVCGRRAGSSWDLILAELGLQCDLLLLFLGNHTVGEPGPERIIAS